MLFRSHLTHLFLTPHPLVFGKGIQLFYNLETEFGLELERFYTVNENIVQYQYKVLR